MWQYSIKILLSASILVAVAGLAKRSAFWGAVLASLPLTSILAFIWLYLDTGKTDAVSVLAQDIFWLVLPSLVLFLMLPLLLNYGVNFWLSLVVSCLSTAGAYLGMVKLLGILDIHI